MQYFRSISIGKIVIAKIMATAKCVKEMACVRKTEPPKKIIRTWASITILIIITKGLFRRSEPAQLKLLKILINIKKAKNAVMAYTVP